MARVSALPALDIISGLKGTLDFYLWKGIPVCRSWPRSPGHKRAAAVEAQWPAFTNAARLWPTLSAEVQQACAAMSAGTPLSNRDIAQKLYLNAHHLYPQIP
jgi:hypothetical protein